MLKTVNFPMIRIRICSTPVVSTCSQTVAGAFESCESRRDSQVAILISLLGVLGHSNSKGLLCKKGYFAPVPKRLQIPRYFENAFRNTSQSARGGRRPPLCRSRGSCFRPRWRGHPNQQPRPSRKRHSRLGPDLPPPDWVAQGLDQRAGQPPCCRMSAFRMRKW